MILETVEEVFSRHGPYDRDMMKMTGVTQDGALRME
jgi:hypothetical protein